MINFWKEERKVKTLNNFGFKHPTEDYKMEEKKKNTPDYNLVVNVGSEDKAIWHKVGAGWKKEKGISIALSSLPMKSNIFLFPYEEKK